MYSDMCVLSDLAGLHWVQERLARLSQVYEGRREERGGRVEEGGGSREVHMYTIDLPWLALKSATCGNHLSKLPI